MQIINIPNGLCVDIVLPLGYFDVLDFKWVFFQKNMEMTSIIFIISSIDKCLLSIMVFEDSFVTTNNSSHH